MLFRSDLALLAERAGFAAVSREAILDRAKLARYARFFGEWIFRELFSGGTMIVATRE